MWLRFRCFKGRTGMVSVVLARQQAGGIGVLEFDDTTLGHSDGRRASDARGPHRRSPRRDVLGDIVRIRRRRQVELIDGLESWKRDHKAWVFVGKDSISSNIWHLKAPQPHFAAESDYLCENINRKPSYLYRSHYYK
jgi:hypothetical protein